MKSIVFVSILIVGTSNVLSASESCYSLGYKYGSCVFRSMSGLPCKTGTDIVIPPRCRNTKETEKGIKDGIKSEK